MKSPRDFGNIISQGDHAVKIWVSGVSRFPTRFAILRTDDGKPREVRDASTCPAAPTARSGTGSGPTASRWTPGPTSSRPGCATSRATRASRRPRSRSARTSPGVPGMTVRGLTAQPPLRPVTAGGRTEFFVDSRSAPYRWRVRRVGDKAVLKRGEATDPNLVFRAPEGASGRLPARAALRPLAHDRAVPGAGGQALDDPRRRPHDHVAGHGQGRRLARSTASRTRSPPAARCAGRACSWAPTGCRPAGTTSRSCSCSWTAGRSATTSRVTSTSISPATRAPATATACCWRARCAGSRARWRTACAST